MIEYSQEYDFCQEMLIVCIVKDLLSLTNKRMYEGKSDLIYQALIADRYLYD